MKQNTSGLTYLMKKNKIEVIEGTASFISNTEISVSKKDESPVKISSRYFIIATGSKPSSLKGIGIDKKRIISSTEALALKEKPGSMAIIGGGVIGVEMASIFARAGVNVTIIEYADSLIPTMDKELGKELKKVLSKLGITILLDHKVQSAKNNGDTVSINYLDSTGIAKELSAEYCLVAVGRKPYHRRFGIGKHAH